MAAKKVTMKQAMVAQHGTPAEKKKVDAAANRVLNRGKKKY